MLRVRKVVVSNRWQKRRIVSSNHFFLEIYRCTLRENIKLELLQTKAPPIKSVEINETRILFRQWERECDRDTRSRKRCIGYFRERMLRSRNVEEI
jgi:hypothetical protein